MTCLATSIPVLLADDHQLFRDALRGMLEKDACLKVVAETGDGLEVVVLAQATSPTVVCMDISMPGMDGIETTRRLLAAQPAIKVIGLSAFSDQRFIAEMLSAGAQGYVTKGAAGDQLLRAIHSVLQGRKYLCPDAAAAMVRAMPEGAQLPVAVPAPLLDTRERQVLQLIGEGATPARIAEELRMAPSTVEVHRRNLMRKLDVHSPTELMAFAQRLGAG